MSLTCFGIGERQSQISTMYLYILGKVWPRFISALEMVGGGILQAITWIEAVGSCTLLGYTEPNYGLGNYWRYPYMHTSS